MPVVLHLNAFLSLTISPYENEEIEQGIKDAMLHLDANPLHWLSWYHEDTKTVSRSSMPFNFVLTLASHQTFLKVPRWNLRALIYQEQSRSVYWMTLAIWPRLENGLHLWPSSINPLLPRAPWAAWRVQSDHMIYSKTITCIFRLKSCRHFKNSSSRKRRWHSCICNRLFIEMGLFLFLGI